jgi:transcriptional regulator with XRE-family HTH domain
MRLAEGLTAADLADRVGILEDTLLYWETKGKRPKESLVQSLANALNVEACVLVNGVPNRERI